MKNPRQYQIDMHNAVVHAYHEQHQQRVLVVMATALGKTVGAAKLIRWWLETYGSRILFLGHLNEALLQAKEQEIDEELKGTPWTSGIRTGKKRINLNGNVLFASFKSMAHDLDFYDKTEFGLIVIDEAHHGQAMSFRGVIDYFTPELLFGMTATPERLDGRDIREIFGEEIYTYDLAQALADGRWLASVDYRVMTDDLDLSKLHEIIRNMEGNRIVTRNQIDKSIFVQERTQRIADIVHEVQEGRRSTIIFCRSVEHLNHVAQFFPEARQYHSGLPTGQNKDALDMFRTGECLTLLAVDMLNEAIDVPRVGLIVFLRSTISETIWKQQLGRGLRRNGYESVIVLDFVANCRRIEEIRHFSNRIAELRAAAHMEVPLGWKIHFQEEIISIFAVLEHLKRDVYPTWEEAAQATQNIGIASSTDYIVRRKEDPRLPSDPRVTYARVWKERHGWPGFLRNRVLGFYSYEEASMAIQKMGIKSSKVYDRRRKDDPRLPSQPQGVYASLWKQHGGWPGFLGTRNYYSYEEAAKAVQSMGIVSSTDYPDRRKEDARLPSNPAVTYAAVWKKYGAWPGFLRNRMLGFYSYEEASMAVQKMGIKTSVEYRGRYKKDLRLPSQPEVVYAPLWKHRGGWPSFLGTKTLTPLSAVMEES